MAAHPDTFHLTRERTLIDGEAGLQPRVYQLVKTILRQWLDFPSDKYCDGQAWVIDILTSAYGFGVLFLDETSEIYSNVVVRALGRRTKNVRQVFLHQLLPFAYRLQFLDCADSTSIANDSLKTFQTHYKTATKSPSTPESLQDILNLSTFIGDDHEQEYPTSLPLSIAQGSGQGSGLSGNNSTTSFDRDAMVGEGLHDAFPFNDVPDDDSLASPHPPLLTFADFSQVQ